MQANPSQPWLSWRSLLLIAPFFLWGTAMVAMKGVMADTTPLFVAGFRLVPAGVLVLVVAAFLGKAQPQTWQAWLWIGLFALVDGALFQGFLAEGLVRTGAGLGSVMIDSQPIAVAILSRLLYAEEIGLWGWLGLGLGICGISFIGLPAEWVSGWMQDSSKAIALEQLFQHGEWLMLLAALSMAAGTVMIRAIARHVDPVVATGWHMIVGGIPLWGLSWNLESGQWSGLTSGEWLGLLYAAVFGGAIAYGLFFFFAAQGNLTSLSALTFLTPVFALAFGSAILGEVLAPWQWMGVGSTLVSIYLINQRDRLKDLLRFRGTVGERSPISEDMPTSQPTLPDALSHPLEMSVSIQAKESESESA